MPRDLVESEFDATASEDEKISDLRVIAVEQISPDPEQPRRHFDATMLETLANSIREHGVLQPIVVVPKKSGYEIVAGERRWRAAKLAGLKKIPAIVRTLSAQHKLELSIIENVQRADLNPLETATAYLKLKNQFNLSDVEIAQRVGKAPSTISNQIRLLNLPQNAKKALSQGEISEGHARQILAIDDEKVRENLLNEIIANFWSVRKAEQFVIGYNSAAKQSGSQKKSAAKKATLEETELTKSIAKKIGLQEKSVRQKITARGGEIVIKFASESDLLKIREIFAGK